MLRTAAVRRPAAVLSCQALPAALVESVLLHVCCSNCGACHDMSLIKVAYTCERHYTTERHGIGMGGSILWAGDAHVISRWTQPSAPQMHAVDC
jgi:hypothetical protein